MHRTPEPKEQARLLMQAMSVEGFVLPHQKALNVVAWMQGHRSWQVMQAMPPAAVPEVVVPEFTVHGFNSADVRTVRPDLTDAQALRVLEIADKYFDASVGLNWEVLEALAREFPEYCVEGLYKDPGLTTTVTVNLANGSIYAGGLETVRNEGWSNRRRLQDAWHGLTFNAATVTLADGTVCELDGYNEVLDGFSDELIAQVDKLRSLEESAGKSFLRTLRD